MEDEGNVIELVGLKKTRPILSFIRHQIERWIEQEQSLDFFSQRSSYRVSVIHEEGPPNYTCQIQVKIGKDQWLGRDSAKTLQLAVERALHHLKGNSLILLPQTHGQTRKSEIVA